MKKVLKIILISFACVVGALGLAVGGFYLFGGFNEKIVYARDLQFNQLQFVSSGTIYMQVNTSTEGVTQTELKLVASAGADRIIDFPEKINIGQTFTVVPKTENGKNIGGNVTLTAYYDSSSADVSANPKCNILIDIPVEQIKAKLTNDGSVKKISPNGFVEVYKKGELVSKYFNINPISSLAPYTISGTKSVEIFADKAIYLEVLKGSNEIATNYANLEYSTDGNVFQTETGIHKVKYKVQGNQLVFDETLVLRAKSTQCEDLRLYSYFYSTYKKQEQNIVEEQVVLNKEDTNVSFTEFAVSSYEIANMEISNTEYDAYLNEEIRIYLKNNAANGINLDVDLTTNAAGINANKYEYRDNIYLTIDNKDYRVLKRANGSVNEDSSTLGLKANYSNAPGVTDYPEMSDNLQDWYWVLNVNDFEAYKSGKLEAKLTYKEGAIEHACEFDINVKLRDIDNLSVNYTGGKDSIRVKSDEKFEINNDLISINSSLPVGVNPSSNDIAYYISYNENFEGGSTTVSTFPNKVGRYFAKFDVVIDGEDDFKAENIVFNAYSSNIHITSATINQGIINAQFTTDQGSLSVTNDTKDNIFYEGEALSVEVYFYTDDIDLGKNLFTISVNSNTKTITDEEIKCYEGILTPGTADQYTYNDLPYLSIKNIRYYMDFDYYTDEHSYKYLILNLTNPSTDSGKVKGIGDFYVTAKYVFNDNGQIYWLGKEANIKVEVYQELTEIVVSSIKEEGEQTNYLNKFGENLSWNEEDDNRHYIFITSPELEALKNYVDYDKIIIEAEQDFSNLENLSTYVGLKDINKNAITFGDNWSYVYSNGVLIGFKNYYEINPITTIKINENCLDNVFNITLKVVANDEDFLAANFKITDNIAENKNYLPITIVDKLLKSAKFEYDGASTNNDGSTKEKAIQLLASSVNNDGTVNWETIDLQNKLIYNFYYGEQNQGDATTQFMTSSVTLVDGSISLTNLYNFDIQANGKGGLTFKNFPYNENGINVKVSILPFTMNDFNSIKVWNEATSTFETTLNSGLEKSLYFNIKGFNIEITKRNTPITVYGYKGNHIDLFGNSGIFDIEISNARGTRLTNINDYSGFMKASITNSNISVNEQLTQITVLNDVMADEDIQFRFFVGSSTNSINIGAGASSIHTLKSAFSVTPTLTYQAPSQNNVFAEILYYNNPENQEGIDATQIKLSDGLTNFLDISLQVILDSSTTSMLQGYGISSPITVEGLNLTFKTIPVEYSATIRFSMSKNNEEGDTTFVTWSKDYTITVTPKYTNNDLTIGSLDGTSYYIVAGENNAISVDNGISYCNSLEADRSTITSLAVTFENVDEDSIDVLRHMNFVANANSIYSNDLNYNKLVRAKVIVTFNDQGKFEFNKVFEVRKNLSLSFANSTIACAGRITLNENDNYIFTKVGTENPTKNFDDYDESNFEYNQDLFEDVSYIIDNGNFVLEAKSTYNKFDVKATIKVIYALSNYNLIFDLPITIQHNGASINHILVTNFACGENNKVATSGATPTITLSEELTNIKADITNITANFENVSNAELINANAHMHFDYNSSTKDFEIWSNSIATDKQVRAIFNITLNNGAIIVITSNFTVTANI